MNPKLDIYNPWQRFLVLDYETYSELDIKKCGSYEYSMHHSTEVLCASWAYGTREELAKFADGTYKVSSWAPKRSWNEHNPNLRMGWILAGYLLDPTVIIIAHNSFFEQSITRNTLAKHLAKALKCGARFIIDSSRFFCTAALSSVYAFPRKLEAVSAALGLKRQKDSEGHKLMLKWCKPKKPSKKDPSTRYTKNFDRLLEYCENDIYVEIDVFLTLPMITPDEYKIWLFDQKINFRGVKVDRELVKKMRELIDIEQTNLTHQLHELTNGEIRSAGQKKVIHKWLSERGVNLPNLQAKTIKDELDKDDIQEEVRDVLQICQSLTKTSLSKYEALLNHTTTDSLIRFSMNYHAASTGRWGGAGVQLQNVPRGSLKHKDQDGKEIDLAPVAASFISEGADLSLIKLLYGDATEVFVSCIRSMIIPHNAHELFVSDFAAIEARMLFWLADDEEGCRAFAEGRKLYEEMAMTIYRKKSIDEITKDERFVGKTTILGAGYGMGFSKFQSQCELLGQEVSIDVAKKAINAYREKHYLVPKLWRNIESAAIRAVKYPSKTFKINHTEWFMDKKFLCCRLPSGRCLYYYEPKIRDTKTPWGDVKPTLFHMGVDSKTKKWVEQKTWGGTLVENVVQAISRDLMALAMLRIEDKGYEIIMTVHDEIVGQRIVGEGNVEEFNSLMKEVPAWASGAPIGVEGYKGFRYRK